MVSIVWNKQLPVRVFLVIFFALVCLSIVVGAMCSVFVSKNDQTDMFKSWLLGTSAASMFLAVAGFAFGYIAMWNKTLNWDGPTGATGPV